MLRSNQNWSRERWILSVLVFLAALASPAGGQPPEGESNGEELQPVHRDTVVLERSSLEAIRSFLREDPVAARRALDQVDRNTRRLDRFADAAYGEEMIVFEQAFHVTLDRARELAGKRRLEDAFNQFVWVQRSCIVCHGLARKQGLLPPLESGDAAPEETAPGE